MSARVIVDGPDAYLLGLADGEEHAAGIAVRQLLVARETIDRQAVLLEASRAKNADLRAKLSLKPWVPAARWAIGCSALTALVVYNATLNGVGVPW